MDFRRTSWRPEPRRLDARCHLPGSRVGPYLLALSQLHRAARVSAVGLGVILAWYWPIGLSLLGMFIVAVAITKYVSVGSLAAAIGLPIAACAVFPYSSLGLKFCMAMIGITVVWAHRSNIQKLMAGKESKLSFTKRVTEPDDK